MERWREQLYLEHSAKGTSWARHKYIRIEDGVYIYPEDLNKKKRSSGGDAVPASTKSNLSDWEIKIHKHIDSIVNKYPNLFGTSEQVAQNILSPSRLHNQEELQKLLRIHLKLLLEWTLIRCLIQN